jgi:hypothetical protein
MQLAAARRLLLLLLLLLRALLLLGGDVRQRHDGSVDPADHVCHHVMDVLGDGVAVLKLEALVPGLGRLRDDLGLRGGKAGVSVCAWGTERRMCVRAGVRGVHAAVRRVA